MWTRQDTCKTAIETQQSRNRCVCGSWSLCWCPCRISLVHWRAPNAWFTDPPSANPTESSHINSIVCVCVCEGLYGTFVYALAMRSLHFFVNYLFWINPTRFASIFKTWPQQLSRTIDSWPTLIDSFEENAFYYIKYFSLLFGKISSTFRWSLFLTFFTLCPSWNFTFWFWLLIFFFLFACWCWWGVKSVEWTGLATKELMLSSSLSMKKKLEFGFYLIFSRIVEFVSH